LELWESYWASDVSRAAQSSDHYALRRWIQAVDERDRLIGPVRDNPTVEGSQGQPVINPLAKRLGEVEKRISDFESEFGMTPKARAQLGIAIGGAAMTANELNRLAAHGDEDENQNAEPEVVEGFIEG
jgi:P27 family predicted phage terminase small subunit